ncbi:cobalamin-5-phosphate synthase-domain-containing protein [Paraphysoderma sedebokerense]|nr:cobalamin-5-phosphate synthase-domain-containing protein [Paraphysoderma sedebokerense]
MSSPKPARRSTRRTTTSSPSKSKQPKRSKSKQPTVEPTLPSSSSSSSDLDKFLYVDSDPESSENEAANSNTEIRAISFWFQELKAFLTGVMFFTRLPCPSWVNHNLYWLSLSTVYFPLLGVIVGGFGAFWYKVTAEIWHPCLGVVFSTLATVWLTGAFHEDGLADTFDGFGGGWGKSEILRIMRDSRIGTYGSIGLFLVVTTKLVTLSLLAMGIVPGLPDSTYSIVSKATGAGHLFPTFQFSPYVLVVGHVLGRWACLYLTYMYDYVENVSAPGKQFTLRVSTGRLIIGTLSTIGFVLWALNGDVYHAVVVMTSAFVVTVMAGRYINSVIDGMIGDCLGASNQIVEVSCYLALSAKWWMLPILYRQFEELAQKIYYY